MQLEINFLPVHIISFQEWVVLHVGGPCVYRTVDNIIPRLTLDCFQTLRQEINQSLAALREIENITVCLILKKKIAFNEVYSKIEGLI